MLMILEAIDDKLTELSRAPEHVGKLEQALELCEHIFGIVTVASNSV